MEEDALARDAPAVPPGFGYDGRVSRRGRRPSLRSPESIGGVLGRTGEGHAGRGTESISMREWEAAVGARIAERAQPIELSRGTLTVRVATSVWASELSLLAAPILERLVAAGHAVTALRYRVGHIEPTPRPASLRVTRVAPPMAALPSALVGTIAAIEDEELRGVVAGAARANLAWQAYVSASAERTPTSGGLRAARVPQSAERESDRQDQTSGAADGATRRRP